jgi:two-component system response regulator FixJ
MPDHRRCSPRGRNRDRICIVDDDEWVADSLRFLLESFGFDVQSYDSGGKFLADHRHRTAGCLIVDLHLPGMNGIEIVECLQKEGIQVPTILISGRLDPIARDRARALGVTNVLEKRFAADRLIELIRAILSEHN